MPKSPDSWLRTLPRQLILVALVSLVFSAFAQAPSKAPRATPASSVVVADSVIKTGSRISGGWREYAADRSWRRVVFTLNAEAGTIVFGDGEPGRKLPSVTHYAWAGSGYKGSPLSYDEARAFRDATPSVLGRANESSPIPSDVATRIRDIGGDIKLLHRLADMSNRMTDIGSAFDAMRRPANDGGIVGGFPGGSTQGKGGSWADPRRGMGRDGRASDDPGGKLTAPDETVEKSRSTEKDGTQVTRVVVRHGDGSTTSRETWIGGNGVSVYTTENDKDGQETSGGSVSYSSLTGSTTTETHHYDAGDGMEHWETRTVLRSGVVQVDAGRRNPSEFGNRRGYEEEVARSLPWLADANYAQWKRESELVKSGGRISQPGGQPTLVLNEGPEVGPTGVVNCGDSNTTPCARLGGVEVDTKGRLGNLSQPGRGVPTGPIDKTPPRPQPEPRPPH